MIRVGVVRGGLGHEYEVSLRTGASVLKHLPTDYQGHDILITKDGTWHLGGVPVKPADLRSRVEVLFNGLHGEYGEDGRIQSLLESLKIPYTGSGPFASAVAMKKPLTKEVLGRLGLKTPVGLSVSGAEPVDAAREVFARIPPPWMVKPADGGSSVGIGLAKNFFELVEAIGRAAMVSDTVLVEEYLPGREATVGVVERFRGQDAYALPVIEIRRPGAKPLWTYDDKYSGETQEICPGGFLDDEKRQLESLAAAAHEGLGLRHYSRSDFILSPRRGIYLLEVNTLPGLTNESLLPKALSAVGCDYPSFLSHVLSLALSTRR